MHEPLVSIVVPCYNGAATLKRTLFSIKNEQYSNFEIIIVDDGSTDSSPDLIRQFEEWDSRFKSVTQENSGVSAARNRGVTVASGEYIGFLDADDLLLENSLDRRMKVLIEESDPEMLGVFCPAVVVDDKNNVLRSTALFNSPLPNERVYFSTVTNNPFGTCCVIAKKKEIVSAGGFDESLTNGEDYDLWFRMMRKGGYFKKVNSCKVAITYHPESVTQAKILKHHRQCKQVMEKIFSTSMDTAIEEFMNGYGSAVYFLALTKRAFSASIKCVINGQHEAAKEISEDISWRMIEQISHEELDHIVKYETLKATCKPENEWLSVWEDVKERVINYIEELKAGFGGECSSLAVLLQRYREHNRSPYGVERRRDGQKV